MLGGFGAGSRRQSSVPKTSPDDTVSQCGNSSPIPRALRLGKLERSPHFVIDSISKTTLDNETIREEAELRAANIKLALDDLFLETEPKSNINKNTRVLSTIASTSDYLSQTIRESKSLDPFPIDGCKDSAQLQEPKKSFRSLENCENITISETNNSEMENLDRKVLNNNHPNGNIIADPGNHHNTVNEEATAPLLGEEKRTTAVVAEEKRWQSLGEVASTPDNDNVDDEDADNVPDKKSTARNSIRSWLVNLFNGNGLRSSDVSLRRGVIAGYDIQSERESIV